MMIKLTIFMATGIVALIVQMVYFILDDRSENHTARDRRLKKWWHWAGGAIHIWMSCAISEIGHDWHVGLLMGALTWFFLDGFINTYVLKREWWYIGETAWLDIMQRKIASTLRIEHRLFSACLKHAVLILSILLLISNLL